jgi:endonuclease/exonuclease/phosphatase family metal-dependent hydrolase
MEPRRLKQISRMTLTITSAVSLLLWALMAILVVRSYWRSDRVAIYSANWWSEWSSARGRFYVRIRMYLPGSLSPFDKEKGWGWASSSSPSGFMQNMQRQSQQFGIDRWQFLGFQSVRCDPARIVKSKVWLRFARGPLWPALVVFAIIPACWLWRRRSWPREQRRMATRYLLLTGSIPVMMSAILLVLLALLFVNARFLGPGETPLSGRTSRPPAPLISDANGVILKVMTYNIWMGGAYRGGWRFEKPQRVAERIEKIGELIRQQQPDIVFLQEVVIDSGPGSFNQVPVLAKKTGMHIWAFGQCVNDGLPFYRMIEGNAILSRRPLEPLTNQNMAGDKAFYEIGYDDQSTLWCKADIGGQDILLASVHLNANDFYEVRLPQVEQLLDFAGDRPAILAGDFNADPNELEIKRIVDTGKFAAKLDGPFTISSSDPHRTIDHIFVPGDWQLLEHRVIQTDLSDHLPVVATYRIP